jgi:hypothetical protein
MASTRAGISFRVDVVMAASAQTPPLWATVPDVPPLPKPEQSGFVNSDGAWIHRASSDEVVAALGVTVGPSKVSGIDRA